MRKIIFGLSSVIFLGFLIFEGRGLILPPPLQLFSPSADAVIKTRQVLLAGQTKPGVKVLVNGSELLPNEQGYFEENLVLQNGLNVLEIKAVKRYVRPRVIERKILVNDETSISKSQEEKPGGI